MTIRTARLPGASNLFGRAGADLSGLPDRESLSLLREGWGCQIQSVISEHFKRLIVAAKMFKFIILF